MADFPAVQQRIVVPAESGGRRRGVDPRATRGCQPGQPRHTPAGAESAARTAARSRAELIHLGCLRGVDDRPVGRAMQPGAPRWPAAGLRAPGSLIYCGPPDCRGGDGPHRAGLGPRFVRCRPSAARPNGAELRRQNKKPSTTFGAQTLLTGKDTHDAELRQLPS